MFNLQELSDREEIRDLLATLTRAQDRGDAELRRTCYLDDAVIRYGIFNGTGAEYTEWVLDGNAGDFIVTQHFLGQSIVQLDGDTAKAETRLLGFHVMPDGEGGEYFDLMGGRYADRFRRVDGVWKISERTTIIDWRYAVKDDQSCPMFPNFDKFNKGRRDRDDLSYELDLVF